MTVGIPGTGIGGLFYLLLAIAMPIRELALTLRGQSSWARWRFIAIQWSLIGGMLITMAGQAMMLKWLAGKISAAFPKSQVTHDLETVVSSSTGLASASLWISLGMLATILLLVQIVRLAVRVNGRMTMPQPA